MVIKARGICTHDICVEPVIWLPKARNHSIFCYEHEKAFAAGTLYPPINRPLTIFNREIPFVLAPFQERK